MRTKFTQAELVEDGRSDINMPAITQNGTSVTVQFGKQIQAKAFAYWLEHELGFSDFGDWVDGLS